jgi:uncharacterized membrane protein
MEFLFAIVIVAVLLGVPLLALVVALQAKGKLALLESAVRGLEDRWIELDGSGARRPFTPGEPLTPAALLVATTPTTPLTRAAAAAAGAPTAAGTLARRLRDRAREANHAHSAHELEILLGGKVLNRVGAVVLVVAVIFLLKHAFDHDWVGPAGRVALGLVAGAVMTGGGLALQRRGQRIFAQGVTGAGLAILYATLYVAHALYGLMPSAAALAAMVAVTVAGALVALAMGSQAVAVVALAGGFLSPLLAGGGQAAFQLALFLLCVDLMALALGTRRGWAWLDAVALAGTNLTWARWTQREYGAGRFASVWGAQALTFLLFALTPYARRLPRRRPFVASDLVLWIGAAAAFFLWSAWLLHVERRAGLGWIAASLAMFHLAQAVLVSGRAADAGVPQPALAFETLLAVALTFAIITVPAELDRVAVTFAWVAEGNLLLWLAVRTGIRWMKAMSFAVLAMALGHMIVIDFAHMGRGLAPQLGVHTAVLLLCAAGYACAGWIAHRAGMRVLGVPVGRWLRIVAGATGLLVISAGLTEQGGRMRLRAGEDVGTVRAAYRWTQAAISIAWALYGAAASALGFARGSAAARWFGLTVFGLLLAKLLLVDLSGLAAVYRVSSLLVAAVVLLGVSWLYTRRGAAAGSDVPPTP